MADSKFPTAEAEPKVEPKVEPKAKKDKDKQYRPTRNWRYGKLYLEGQKYDMEGIPQDDIDSAVEQGHLEVC
jgi:hypothetical protein